MTMASTVDAVDTLQSDFDVEGLLMRMKILSQALQLSDLYPDQHLPKLSRYFPQNVMEIEIQNFNLYGQLPTRIVNRKIESSSSGEAAASSSSLSLAPALPTSTSALSTEEELMMWFLEKDTLRRDLFAHFLLQSTTLSRNTLSRLLQKICPLEIAQSFVEGLKYFLSVSGLWEEYLMMDAQDARTLYRAAVGQFVQSHSASSRKPLFGSAALGDSQLHAAVDVAFACIEASHQLHVQRIAETTVLAQFGSAVRSAAATLLTPKQISEIFSAIAASCVPPLRAPLNAPSYLFSGSMHCYSNLSVRFDSDFQSPALRMRMRLCRDAIYFFQEQQLQQRTGSAQSHWQISAVLPLCSLRVERVGVEDNDEVLELSHTLGQQLLFVNMRLCSQGTLSCAAPSSIRAHQRILLDFSNAQALEQEDGSRLDMEQLYDDIESCCWSCRSSSSPLSK